MYLVVCKHNQLLDLYLALLFVELSTNRHPAVVMFF